MRELIAPALAVVLVLWFGFARLAEPVPSRGELKVALVQPSIPQVMIWDPKEKAARFAKLMELSENALATKPDLLVWPEAALPALDDTMTQSIFEMVRKHRVWLLLGADDAEPRAGSDDPKNAKFYNSAFLLSPDGQVAGRYRKQRLVIFGEYVPLVKWLPFLKYLTPVGDGFTPGDHAVQFDLKEPRVRFAPLICFEDVFAAAGREATEPDTDFLVNVTNDGWFGESAEQWQHAANSVFRAVENGLPLVRCANNGVSCWVDARGVMRATHFEGSDNVYQAGFKTVKVPLPLNTARQTTFYNRYGDWFGWACVVVSALLTVLNWRRSRTH
ncbi:MAG: apolipoprotein N-acyltransferase [Verrucomicrobia bacterium]|nr:apolipoprotein N-acyltransferase [Verrucomicrobiota bacterium]